MTTSPKCRCVLFRLRILPGLLLLPAALLAQPPVRAVRLLTNPIIKPGMPHLEGKNINGPSLICPPPGIERPLAGYYLYFADHGGKHIRLALADDLAGPWRIHPGGTLKLEQTACRGHIASPDVHIDQASGEIRMYFHGPSKQGPQMTYIATSRDGLNFTARPQPLGPFYFRVFRHGEWFYAIAKNENTSGVLLRSRDGLSPFERGPDFIEHLRHTAVKVDGDTLWLFYSRIGDAPEHILLTRIDLRQDWTQWEKTMSPPQSILKPEMDYEGVQYPIAPSRPSAATHVRQLRDPGLFTRNGRTWLLYSVAGETGLAAAELVSAAD